MVTSFYPFVSVTPKSNSTDPFPEKHSLFRLVLVSD